MIFEIFKSWISSMLCIGIFIAFIQLMMPKTNLKKYIYSLIGIVTILTVVSPIINMFENQTVETSVKEVLFNISGNNQSTSDISKVKLTTEELVKKEFLESVKVDIKSKLIKKGVGVNDVRILISNTYDIDKIEVYIKNIQKSSSTLDSVNKVVSYINSEYDIEYSKIIVIEEAE